MAGEKRDGDEKKKERKKGRKKREVAASINFRFSFVHRSLGIVHVCFRGRSTVLYPRRAIAFCLDLPALILNHSGLFINGTPR